MPKWIISPVNSAKGQQDIKGTGEPNVPEDAEIIGLILYLIKRNLMWDFIATMSYLVRR